MNITIEDVLTIGRVDAANISVLTGKKFTDVSTDTRVLKPGTLFFALRGSRVDGHAFIREAFAKGASCAVIDKDASRDGIQNQPVVVVQDTIRALGELALRYRSKFAIPIVAVGGSNGKTTTKEMISAVLRKRYKVHQTRENFNNHIGVPMTIFGLTGQHDMAVVEIGTNHFGEVKYLSGIVRPTHALVTTIEREHLEFFSSIDGVEREEGEIFRALDRSGVAFVNADDERIARQAQIARHKITYGFSSRAGVRGAIRGFDADGAATLVVSPRDRKAFEVQLALAGRHNAANALSAAAVGLTFKVPARDIQSALHGFRAVERRMETYKTRGVTIINDTYNANTDSVMKAISTLQDMKCRGKKIIILGDMLELGAEAEAEHRKIGCAVAELGFEYLLTYGQLAHFINDAAGKLEVNLHYDQKNSLAEYALELIGKGDIVLVKGSRGMKMEDIVSFLLERGRRNPS